MNFREGMRRIGIVLGVCGAVVAGGDAWSDYTHYRNFQSVMALPTMQRIAKAAQQNQAFIGQSFIPEEDDRSLTLDASNSLIKGNQDGISQVGIDPRGTVSWIQPSIGFTRLTRPSELTVYLQLFLYPPLGFLVP